MIELTEQQQEALVKAKKWWKNRNSSTFEISGAAGTGKAQPIDTIIPTPDGDRLLGDLKVGDYVFNRLGQPVKVLGVYDQGLLDAYEVIFDDGRRTICNDEHLWCAKKGSKKSAKFKIKTTREMMNHGLVDTVHRGHIFKVPINSAVEYPEKEYSIDPYVIGAFIGNGCCKQHILTFSSNDIETVQEITKLIGATNYRRSHETNYNYMFLVNENDKKLYKHINHIKYIQTKTFFKDYPELIGGSKDKRIPNEYFYGSIEQRWSLIQGLFDTDGCITVAENRFNIVYTSVNLPLIHDIRKLLLSLGCCSTIRANIREGKSICYELYAKVDNAVKINFFRLKRKKDIAKLASKYIKNHIYSTSYIYDIKNLGYKTEMRCIYVDDPEHLYLTNDYIVTHNTTVVSFLIDALGLNHDDVLFLAYVGKATLALSRKGNNAHTIHSAIYDAIYTPKLDENGNIITINGKIVTTIEFIKKEYLEKNIKLIVVDEGAMVSEKLALDILSFGLPVIALGDNNQLDPIFGERFFLKNPDVTLTEPMRQALDSPIIYLAQRAMKGKMIREGKYGDSCYVIDKSMITDNMLAKSDVVLCNRNKTRDELNRYIRNDIMKINSEVPKIGEKLICRQNNWSKCLLNNIYLINGMVGYVDNVYLDTYNGRTITIDFRPDFLEYDYFKKLKIDFKHLNSVPDSKNMKRSFYEKFEYGYAITTFLAQGAEWDKVFVYAEQYGTVDFQKKVLYTAITRAKKFLILAF